MATVPPEFREYVDGRVAGLAVEWDERYRARQEFLQTTLRALEDEMRGHFEGLNGQFHGLRSEIEGLRDKSDGQFHGLRSEMEGLRSEVQGVRVGLEGRMAGLDTKMDAVLALVPILVNEYKGLRRIYGHIVEELRYIKGRLDKNPAGFKPPQSSEG